MNDQQINKTVRLAIVVLVALIIFRKLIPFLIIVLIFYVLYKVASKQPIVPYKYQQYIPIKFSFLKKTFNFNKVKNMDSMETLRPSGHKNIKKWVGSLVVLFVGLIFVGNFFVIIEAGETGVQSLFGRVRDNEFQSGFHLKNPFVRIHKMNIRTQEYTMSIVREEGRKIGNDSIAALTKEGLQVDLDITVLYHLKQDQAADVYKNLGLNYEDIAIRPQIRSSIREIIAQYEAKDIYSEKRQEASNRILESIKLTVDSRGIEIEEVLLRNIQLPENLAKSIQEKLQAEQEAQRYEFVLQREEKEAERKRVEAAGQRDAQKIINESLTARYLEYLYIQSLKDRAGTIYVPTSPNSGMPLFKGV